MNRNKALLRVLGGTLLIVYPSYKLFVAYSTGVIQVRKRITASIEQEPFLFWVGVVTAIIFVFAGIYLVGSDLHRRFRHSERN